ncbi:hypothetical protein KAI58_02380 [Candidatus Gracilibacteria bacterium]|nr:hypothetical protein [Candidatus Gracilibacteria bacterium]
MKKTKVSTTIKQQPTASEHTLHHAEKIPVLNEIKKSTAKELRSLYKNIKKRPNHSTSKKEMVTPSFDKILPITKKSNFEKNNITNTFVETTNSIKPSSPPKKRIPNYSEYQIALTKIAKSQPPSLEQLEKETKIRGFGPEYSPILFA